MPLTSPRAIVVLIGLAVSDGACDRGPDKEQEAQTARLNARIVQLKRASAQRDSLFSDAVKNAQFVQAISEQLARVKSLPRGTRLMVAKTGESPVSVASFRDSVLAQIVDLTNRLNASEARLALSKQAVAGSGHSDRELLNRIEEAQKLITSLREQVARQEEELTSLRTEVGVLRQDKARLARDNGVLTERMTDLAEASGTVYYVAGTKAQLEELGVIREVGGSRNFFFRRSGQTLVPQTDLHADDFHPLSRTGNTQIVLPNAAKEYAIVSQHNASYLDPVSKDGTIRGTVRITDPIAFWSSSRFLILVER